MNRIQGAALAMLLLGCVDTIQDAVNPPGELNPRTGKINPCHGWESDKEACGNAKFNAKVIGKVGLGQSKEQVLATMQHPPRRREVKAENGVTVEMWGYETNYNDELMTWITFRDDKVSEINEKEWDEQ